MIANSLVWPMFAMVLLAFSVLLRLFLTRTSNVNSGAVTAEYFKTYQGATEPEKSLQLSRSFINQFEAPVLFYAACITAMVVGATGTVLVVLAWLYVALRVVHMYIHTGSNRLMPRIRAYFGSWIVLLAMWALVALHTTGIL